MRLMQAAKFFDKTVCKDAYGLGTFLGQLDLYDDSKRDGLTVERRILSTAPDVVLPARRTIQIEGESWIIGFKNVDTFQGAAIRHKYVIHRAATLGTIQTPKQKLTTGGVSLYSSAVWLKDAKEVATSSRLYSFMNTFFALSETVVPGDILTLGADSYRIRNVYESAAGVKIGEANIMPSNTKTTASYKALSAQVYNAATDSYGVIIPTTIDILWERFQDSYVYESQAAPTYEVGDMLIVVQKSIIASPRAADEVTIQGELWKVVSFQDDNRNCWEMQVRRG
jgi:hypothetical protein